MDIKTKLSLIDEDLTKIIESNGIIMRTDTYILSEKYKINRSKLVGYIQKIPIPYQSGDLKTLLKSYGIFVFENKIKIEEFFSLGDWRNIAFINCKIRVSFICKNCKCESSSILGNFTSRDAFKNIPLCNDCLKKEICNSPEWKKKNSDSQKISQNKPEQLEKNRNAQLERFKDLKVLKSYSDNSKKRWQDPEYRKKMTQIVIDRWKDPVYARKVIENSKKNFKYGFYKDLYYQSSYELAFMLKFEYENKSIDNIERCSLNIRYEKENGKFGYYYPDYIINKNTVIEVKGYGPWVNYENLARKNKAAKKWCKENNMKFRVVELADFGYIWLNIALKKHKEIKDGKTDK